MKVNNINSDISFGKLYCGGTIINRLGRVNCSKQFKNEFKAVNEAIRSNNLHELENVDLTLNYGKKDGFFAVVSNPEFGAPDAKGYKHKIKTEPESLKTFSSWAQDWNTLYAYMKDFDLDSVAAMYRFIRDSYKF